MRTFWIRTLGCKVNQSESETMAGQLSEAGYRSSPSGQTADFCIINTCTVTAKASMQSRQAIRKAIRQHPHARIIVTGCYAQTEPEQIWKIQGVHDVVDHFRKADIPGRISLSEPPPATASHPTGDRSASFIKGNSLPEYRGERTRHFLKIQDGCNARCTYCIVPRARGPSRSMPMEDVLTAVARLKSSGCHEVVLTGIHLGSYGLDFSPAASLYMLMKRIEDTGAMERVRLSSIEPLELKKSIIHLVAESSHFCPHFHIPLQSGDNDILKRMQRPYTREVFKSLVMEIAASIPEAAIGVDILIGFPGETDEAFKNTYTLIEELPVAYLHLFPFSPRPGTPAAALPNALARECIKSRVNKLRRLGEHKKSDFLTRFTDLQSDILIEGKRDRYTGKLVGTTDNYIKVFIDGHDHLMNSIIPVRLEALNATRGVFGRHLRDADTLNPAISIRPPGNID